MSKITKSAQGEECLVRIPFVCNHDPETTVFAHLGGAGMGMKHPDSEGAYCCSACHDVYDGRVPPPGWGGHGRGSVNVKLDFLNGCVRTRAILIEKGLLICL